MKFHWGSNDGGPESHVRMYGLESKEHGSLLVLKFLDGSREAYHSHAFSAVSWLLSGFLVEEVSYRDQMPFDECYEPSIKPIVTPRERFHKVSSMGTSWVLSLRSAWVPFWVDRDLKTGRQVVLTHGRKVVA